MSLRDELQPGLSSYKPIAEQWLETKDDDFQAEFYELLNDRTVQHSALYRLAVKYGLTNLRQGPFSEWRKRTWL